MSGAADEEAQPPELIPFDDKALRAALAAGEPPLPRFREALQQANERLEFLFRDNTPIQHLVAARARFIDRLLVCAWRQLLPGADEGMALVAVGGYGRGELHPHSDIDLMLLADEAQLERYKEALEQFLLLLWDIGLDIGHSVRTLAECIEESRKDITVATNLMEARLLSGDRPLFETMRRQTDRDHLWSGPDFFRAKWQEQIARHRKFHDTAYNLEPNIKEGPGGLRDIQMIGWVVKRHYNADTLDELVSNGFLTSEEYDSLFAGQEFLWTIRWGLHTLTGRREDRLLFDHQRTLAKLFGYRDDGQRLAVEHFMKEYYRTVMELERLNEMLLQLFQEEILGDKGDEPPQPLNSRFQLRRGFVELAHPKVFEHTPFALLELFLIMAQHPEAKGVRAETIRQIRQNRFRIDEAFRGDIRNRALFIELLRQPSGLTHQLRRMNRYGVLAAYLPEFGRIVGQMQHDLFHVYTVDEHTLMVLRNLRRLTVAEFHHEFPLCSDIIARLPKPELLYVAALYHDIAKGRGGDHSELGAVDAEAFCRRHTLSGYDTHLVSWLVRHHLIMSTTAQRKDISDPDVIHEFARQVGSQNFLDYLYLLTVADVRATSPTVWNSWKDALLAELYHQTSRALRRGLAKPIAAEELIAETKSGALERLAANEIEEEEAEPLWGRLADDYFLRYSADEIACHTRGILRQNDGRPLVLLRPHAENGGTRIFIYAPLRPQQFTNTTAVLDQLGLNIVDARIIASNDGYTLDTYTALEHDGQPISSSFRLHEIEQTLIAALEQTEGALPPASRPVARQLKHFPIPTQVAFQQDPYNPRTIIEVVASDRPGLLSRIARAISRCELKLQNAKIATLGERVEDIFYLTDKGDQPITDEAIQERLRTTVIEEVDS